MSDAATRVAPLAGRTIAVTRPADRAAGLVATLRALGAEVIACPAITIEPPEMLAELDAVLARIASFDWIAVTSVAAVDAVADRLAALGVDAVTTLGTGPRVAAVGDSTAAAARARFGRCDVVAEQQTADGLAAALPSPGRTRVLFPCADRARDTLSAGLRARGAIVESVIAYRTVAEARALDALAEPAIRDSLDAVLLASPSAAEALAEAFGRAGAPVPRLVCIGPATAARCRELGLAVASVAESPSDDALAAAACVVLETLR